jgi:hypothetical protein
VVNVQAVAAGRYNVSASSYTLRGSRLSGGEYTDCRVLSR